MKPALLVIVVVVLSPSLAVAEPQSSFVDSGGILRPGEHAVVIYADAELLAPPITLGYRYGLLGWLEVGADVGANTGLFQAILHAKVRLLETRSRLFYWGLRFRGGYKVHDTNIGEEIVFDDQSWVAVAEHAVAIRLGRHRDKALYLATLFYADIDLRTPQRQTDYYLIPATLGYEGAVTEMSSFFIEIGAGISLNGTETFKGLLYDGDIFPLGQLGFSVRFR